MRINTKYSKICVASDTLEKKLANKLKHKLDAFSYREIRKNNLNLFVFHGPLLQCKEKLFR